MGGLVEQITFLRNLSGVAFMAANAWAAERGHKSLYERSGARPYDPVSEGTLDEAMVGLTALLLSRARKQPYVNIADELHKELGI